MSATSQKRVCCGTEQTLMLLRARVPTAEEERKMESKVKEKQIGLYFEMKLSI